MAARAGVSNAGVQLTLQAARGYARMGDSRATQMLADGQKMLSKLPESDHPEHHFVFDRDKHEFYAATVYTWLGTDDTAAREHAVWVVQQCRRRGEGSGFPMRLANSEVDLALLASRHGGLDEAVALGQSALKLERRSAQLIPRAVELKQDLAARYPHERLTDEYREALRDEIGALPPGDADSLRLAMTRRMAAKALSS